MVLKPSLNMEFNCKAWARHQELSACFAYALNAPGLRSRNLGDLKEARKAWRNYERVMNIEFVRNKADEQGLLLQEERDFNPSKEHIIATFTAVAVSAEWGEEFYDCHHIRLDGDGNWSHKPGRTPAEQIIIPGNISPSEYLHQLYKIGKNETRFIGFFKVPDKGLEIHERPGQLLP